MLISVFFNIFADMRIIIADSGSTKTDWCLVQVERQETRIVNQIQTEGINPVHMNKEVIIRNLAPLKKMIGEESDLSLCTFYGAGCTGDYAVRVQQILTTELQLPLNNVQVHSDMLGAARAVCGHEAGIACILGTGSNSCFYDGIAIIDNIPPLGYILGDEGSGAALGKLFLNAVFKRELPDDLCRIFLEETRQTYEEIIEKVYRNPLANRYLASSSTFISKHLTESPELERLVVDNFRAFFRKNIAKYQHLELPVGAIGSIAFHYNEQLRTAAAIEGLHMGKIMKSPMQGLLEYTQQLL